MNAKLIKRITSYLIIIALSFTLFGCKNKLSFNRSNFDPHNNETEENAQERNIESQNTNNINNNNDINFSEGLKLIDKIKNLCNKDVIKNSLDGKSISEFTKDKINDLTSQEKANINNNIPDLSLNESNFENDDKTYIWLSDALKKTLKYYINNGTITQKNIDYIVNENKTYLTLLNIKAPSVTIKKGMADKEIEQFAIELVDVIDKITEPFILKLLGIDMSNSDYIDEMLSYLKG